MINKINGNVQIGLGPHILSKSSTQKELLNAFPHAKLKKSLGGWEQVFLGSFELANHIQYCVEVHFLNDQIAYIDFTINPGDTDPWKDWSEEQQQEEKRVNDELLERDLGPPPYQYDWGTVISKYDQRSAFSSIVLNYKKN